MLFHLLKDRKQACVEVMPGESDRQAIGAMTILGLLDLCLICSAKTIRVKKAKNSSGGSQSPRILNDSGFGTTHP